jgi:nucleoside-diphosphate-sugar epimerase
MEKIFITGSNGFIGKKLTDLFLLKGYEVTALTSKNNLRNINNLKYIYCPMSEYHNFTKFVNSNETYDGFIHLGWQATSGQDRNNFEIQLTNFMHSKILFENILKSNQFKQVIGFGSILEDEFLFDNLNDRNSKKNHYGLFKLITKKTLFSIFDNTNIKSNWIKFVHIYGPGDSKNRFIHSTLSKIINKSELHFSSGNQAYDFIYIDDAVQLIYKIYNASLNSQTITLSTNSNLKLKEYINMILKQFNLEKEVYFDLQGSQDNLPQSFYEEKNELVKNFHFAHDFVSGIIKTYEALINEKF